VHAGCDRRRIVERAGADEVNFRRSVLAVDGDLTVRTAIDPLGTAALTRHIDRLRRFGEDFDAVGLDQ